MNFQFEFEYNAEERKRIDALNSPRAIGPAVFGVVWCLCFLPTVLGLIWFQMWSMVIAGVVLILMASFVPMVMKLRQSAPEELARRFELNSVGKRESTGDTTTFVKWNIVDEIIESDRDFLFSRNDRYSLLPKRVIDDTQFQDLREQLASWRNRPEASTEPAEMYRRLFEDAKVQTWTFTMTREDLVAATKSTSIRPVNEKTFNFTNVEFSKGTPRWLGFLLFGLMIKAGLLLLVASLPPNRMDLLPLMAFLCLNPIVLLFVAAHWVRRRGIRSVPRSTKEELTMGLFAGGWAIGNEDMVAFNQWNQRSAFFVAKEFVGIRSDLGLIHILPMRGFNGPDGAWQFLDRAIRLKKQWLRQKSGDATDTQTADADDNEQQQTQSVNPYRSPPVNIQ